MAKTKRPPPNRGRASSPPPEIVALQGRPAMWRPRHAPEGSWILCVVMGLRFRYGTWDLLLIPVAGDGTFWAEQQWVAPTPNQELEPAALLADLERRAIEQVRP
jgi:hypothetical protein